MQSFAEKLYAEFDKKYEQLANQLLQSARVNDGKAHAIAFKMDGISDAVAIVKETYKLFVTEEKEKEDDARSLY